MEVLITGNARRRNGVSQFQRCTGQSLKILITENISLKSNISVSGPFEPKFGPPNPETQDYAALSAKAVFRTPNAVFNL